MGSCREFCTDQRALCSNVECSNRQRWEAGGTGVVHGLAPIPSTKSVFGVIAQMVERLDGIEEAAGSIPADSTARHTTWRPHTTSSGCVALWLESDAMACSSVG